jgi:hypothetical protein
MSWRKCIKNSTAMHNARGTPQWSPVGCIRSFLRGHVPRSSRLYCPVSLTEERRAWACVYVCVCVCVCVGTSWEEYRCPPQCHPQTCVTSCSDIDVPWSRPLDRASSSSSILIVIIFFLWVVFCLLAMCTRTSSLREGSAWVDTLFISGRKYKLQMFRH